MNKHIVVVFAYVITLHQVGRNVLSGLGLIFTIPLSKSEWSATVYFYYLCFFDTRVNMYSTQLTPCKLDPCEVVYLQTGDFGVFACYKPFQIPVLFIGTPSFLLFLVLQHATKVHNTILVFHLAVFGTSLNLYFGLKCLSRCFHGTPLVLMLHLTLLTNSEGPLFLFFQIQFQNIVHNCRPLWRTTKYHHGTIVQYTRRTVSWVFVVYLDTRPYLCG